MQFDDFQKKMFRCCFMLDLYLKKHGLVWFTVDLGKGNCENIFQLDFDCNVK